jgi:hypothetical protein
MKIFRARLALRYTRISCMPFQAILELDRLVQGMDRDDALRQACLCVDRELDEILARVNTQNVTEIWIEPRQIVEAAPPADDLWNPDPFPPEQSLPRYIVLKGQ